MIVWPNEADIAPEALYAHARHRRRVRSLSEIAVDPANDERYPDGTVPIQADSPDASALMSQAIEKRGGKGLPAYLELHSDRVATRVASLDASTGGSCTVP